MTAIKTKSTDVIANKIEQTGLSKYQWPRKIILGKGTEFMKEVIWIIEQDYGITRCPITTQNPQENSILERTHQTIGNILRMFQVNNYKLEWFLIRVLPKKLYFTTLQKKLCLTSTFLVKDQNLVILGHNSSNCKSKLCSSLAFFLLPLLWFFFIFISRNLYCTFISNRINVQYVTLVISKCYHKWTQ